jgi:hypothetical protein
VLVIGAAVMLYQRQQSPGGSSTNSIAGVDIPPSRDTEPAPPSPPAPERVPDSSLAARSRQQAPPAASNPAPAPLQAVLVPDEVATDPEATRAPRPGTPIVAPRDIVRIYLDLGSNALGNQLRARLAAAFDRGGLAVTSQTDDAQAALKGTVKAAVAGRENPQVVVQLRLVDAGGSTLWPVPRSAMRYQGNMDEIAARIAADLRAFTGK